jgi:hypothetical protein
VGDNLLDDVQVQAQEGLCSRLIYLRINHTPDIPLTRGLNCTPVGQPKACPSASFSIIPLVSRQEEEATYVRVPPHRSGLHSSQ